MNPTTDLLAVTASAHGRHFHVSGLGRTGTEVVQRLMLSGANVSGNDHQRIDTEAYGALMHVRRADLGRRKADVLARFLDGRSELQFESVVARTESSLVDPFIERAHAVLSCANTVSGRAAAERKSQLFGKPCIQIAVLDGRHGRAGVVTVRTPENAAWGACFSCFIDGQAAFPRGEILLPTVCTTVAAVGANVAPAHADPGRHRILQPIQFHSDQFRHLPDGNACRARQAGLRALWEPNRPRRLSGVWKGSCSCGTRRPSNWNRCDSGSPRDRPNLAFQPCRGPTLLQAMDFGFVHPAASTERDSRCVCVNECSGNPYYVDPRQRSSILRSRNTPTRTGSQPGSSSWG